MLSNDWLERELYDLANVAWGPRRVAATEAFILRPESLSSPSVSENIPEIVEQLYSHARLWCPGFDVPLNVPKERDLALAQSSDLHRPDSDRDPFVEISTGLTRSTAGVLAVLAHVACHHILDLSDFRGATREDDEKKAALAMFICGFGNVFLQGYADIRVSDTDWAAVHLGYLTEEQYRFAQNWVLRVQRLSVTKVEQANETAPRQNQRQLGFFARILSWWRSRSTGSSKIVDAVFAPAVGAGQSNRPFSDANVHQYQVALARLGGDEAALERLIEYERLKQPYADERTLLDAVMESFERDRS